MDITEDLVRHVAHLARLDLTPAEVSAMAPQLARIFSHVEQVQEIETSAADAEQGATATVSFDSLREDTPGPTLGRRAITKNAPHHDGSFLVVPHVMRARAATNPDTPEAK